MVRFIPFEWSNSDELASLCQDLDLVPAFMITKSMLDYWKEVFCTEFTKELTKREIEVAKTYREMLMKEYFHNRRFNRNVFVRDLQVIPFNQD